MDAPTGRVLPLSYGTVSRLCRKNDVGAIPHGFRSWFRDWAKQTEPPRAAMEAALAHGTKNNVEAAYARSDLFEKRRNSMAVWVDHLAVG